MFRRNRLPLLMCLLLIAAGPTSQPAMVPTDLGHGFMIDIPETWILSVPGLVQQAFAQRSGARLDNVIHLKGGRPTDLPYATIEQMSLAGMVNPTATQQQQMAQMVADYYATAFNPPSKADRPPLFKRAKVTPVKFDTINGRFTFSVVVKYDMIGDFHVEVAGCFGTTMLTVTSIWTDAGYYDPYKPSILAMRDSLRLGSPPARATAGAFARHTAQIGAGAIVIALAVIQTLVLVKRRRDRRAEEERILSQIEG